VQDAIVSGVAAFTSIYVTINPSPPGMLWLRDAIVRISILFHLAPWMSCNKPAHPQWRWVNCGQSLRNGAARETRQDESGCGDKGPGWPARAGLAADHDLYIAAQRV